jgi:lariat debranching enzyme
VLVAVFGCAHGELGAFYAAVREAARAASGGRQGTNAHGADVDLALCAGGSQAARNEDDLECMAVPDKSKDMRSSWKHNFGWAAAPIPTVSVCGNHVAANILQERQQGSIGAPNMHYKGTRVS